LRGEGEWQRRGTDTLKLLASQEGYHHRESEGGGVVGAEFSSLRHRLQAEWVRQQGDWRWVSGAGAGRRSLRMGGFVYTPHTEQWNGALWQLLQRQRGAWLWQGALRGEANSYTPSGIYAVREGVPVPARDFLLGSAALRVQWQASEEFPWLRLDVALSQRAPTAEELYSQGPHLAAYTYETGDPGLPTELGAGAELALGQSRPDRRWSFALWQHRYPRYLLQQPTGAIDWSSNLPIWQATAVEATLQGVEASAERRLQGPWWLQFSGDYTRGEQQDRLQTPLPEMPPWRLSAGVERRGRSWRESLELRRIGTQGEVAPFEEPTRGALLLDAEVSWQGQQWGVFHRLSGGVGNLLDTRWYNHLSRLRSVMPETGRDLWLNWQGSW